MATRAMLVAAAVLSWVTGCGAEEGILEVRITAPALAEGEPRYMFVQARSSDYDFDLGWIRRGDPEGLLLSENPQPFELSVGSEREVEAVRLRVRFCHSPRCDADARDDTAPEVRYELPRPYCLGEHTTFDTAIPSMPTGVAMRTIAPCDVCGCEARRRALGCAEPCVVPQEDAGPARDGDAPPDA